jgi:hypothetical protein
MFPGEMFRTVVLNPEAGSIHPGADGPQYDSPACRDGYHPAHMSDPPIPEIFSSTTHHTSRTLISMEKAGPQNLISGSALQIPTLLFVVAAVLCLERSSFASTNNVTYINHTILKEPTYQSAPKYSLLTFGTNSDVKVWMVEDGQRLFVDKNANGDLTDDGPPIEPSNVRHLDDKQWDFEYKLDAITPASGSPHTKFVLSRWNYNDPLDEYGLSLTVDGKMPMYAGWFGTFWSTNREQAPVIHFGGPFTPKLLRREAFTIGERGQRLSLCFVNPGSGPGATSRLSIEALPRYAIPDLTIEWPTAPGSKPLRTSHELTQRCCYWEFYIENLEIPKGVVPGKALVTVNLLSLSMPIELTTTKITEPVVTH